MSLPTANISIFDHLRRHFGSRLELIPCTKATMIHLSHTLEDLVLREQLPALMFTGFQESSHWATETARYRQIAAVAQQVCIFAGGHLPEEGPANELRVTLVGDDPLRQEWFIAILSERFCVVLCGQDRAVPKGQEAVHQFATLWTFEPQIVHEVLDLIDLVVTFYRPDRIDSLREARRRFPPVNPDATLMTQFTRELIRFEERLYETLREREQFLLSIYEGMGASIFVLDAAPEGAFRFAGVNPAYTHATGLDDASTRGRDPADILPAAAARILTDQLGICVERGATMAFEEQLPARTGEPPAWWLTTLHPLHNAAGRVYRVVGSAQNITARKRAEIELVETNELLKARNRELERRTSEISLLSSMGELMQACRTAREAHAVMRKFLPQLFTQISGLLGIASNGDMVDIVAEWGEEATSSTTFSVDDCWALRRGRPHIVMDAADELICTHLRGPLAHGAACFPLMAQGRSLGVLHLHASAAQRVDEQLATTVAEQLALALNNLRLRERLRGEAIRDSLTGLYNRRFLYDTLARELRRSQMQPVSVIMLDVDHFKLVNDQLGHSAGDGLLRTLGRLLQSSVRDEDIACRYGGEEFVLVLPGATLEAAANRAEALRVAVSQLVFPHDEEHIRDISVSVGVASFPQHGRTTDHLLQMADAALYAAKDAGRNQVFTADRLLGRTYRELVGA